MITDVVFDLDDTLCEFSAARRRGVARACAFLPEERRAPAVDAWLRREPALYAEFAAGRISRETYRWLRFHEALLETGQVPSDHAAERQLVAAMNDAFMQEINDGVTVTPGAQACLDQLVRHQLHCHLLTNGPADSQRRRLSHLGLDRYLTHVFIAEEIGHFKPDPAAFSHALGRIGRPAGCVVMVGDDLAADIAPALRAGMHAIHYAPLGSGHRSAVSRFADLALAIERLHPFGQGG